MFELLLLIIVLFIFYNLIKIIYVMFRLLKSYMKGEIQLSIEEKKDIQKSFCDGVKLVLRHIFLLK